MVERVTVSLDKEIVEELRRLSRQEGKPVSALVREAVEKWILHERKRHAGEELLRLVRERPKVEEEAALKELEKIREEWR